VSGDGFWGYKSLVAFLKSLNRTLSQEMVIVLIYEICTMANFYANHTQNDKFYSFLNTLRLEMENQNWNAKGGP
jgi:hypothetical protein